MAFSIDGCIQKVWSGKKRLGLLFLEELHRCVKVIPSYKHHYDTKAIPSKHNYVFDNKYYQGFKFILCVRVKF